MRRALFTFSIALFGFACSGDDVPEVERPSPTEVRNFYALNPGSCFRYRIPAKNTFGRVEISGPNEQSIAGRTVFDQELFLDTAARPYRWQLEVTDEAEVRLVRAITGSGGEQITKRYEAVDPPVYARFVYDRSKMIEFDPNARFEVDTAPEICSAAGGTCESPGILERHSWVVLDERKMVPTPDGELEAIQLQYRRTIEGTTDTARYDLVPGRGIASFVDFEGTIHTICAWKTCDAAGVCNVTTPCNELMCQN